MRVSHVFGACALVAALAGCSKNRPGPAADTTPPSDDPLSARFIGANDRHRVRVNNGRSAQVWLEYDCQLTGDFRLTGTIGYESEGVDGPAAVAPVPLVVDRNGATLSGLPRSKSGSVAVRERSMDGERRIAGYAYLFDLPASPNAFVIVGNVTASGAVCEGGVGRRAQLYYTHGD